MWDMPINTDRSFSLSRNKHGTKTYVGNRRVEEAKKMKCYIRLIHKLRLIHKCKYALINYS